MTQHLMAPDRDVCLRCGKTAQDIVDTEAQSRCYGEPLAQVAAAARRLAELRNRLGLDEGRADD